MTRAIERRIIERFQDVTDDDLQAHGNTAAKKVANAQDEAILYVYVPRMYADHWEHFAGLVRCLYIRGGDPTFAALKARQLAQEAVKPKAPLLEISYAWEGLGKPALFAIDPLLTDPRPDVRFAAARAAAFIGDRGAVPVLLDIASSPGNEFRVRAVETLGELPPSPRVDAMCRSLLDSDQATVRIAAYQLLSRHGDPSIFTRWVKDGDKEIFALDVIRTTGRPGSGPPLVYASDRGVPRVAVFGSETAIDLPMIFSTLEDRLLIASTGDSSQVTVSYRSPYRRDLLGFTCPPTLPSLIAFLGGDGAGGASATRLHLGYADVVAVLQGLIDGKRVSGPTADGRLAATFVLGDPLLPKQLPVNDGGLIRVGNPAGRPNSDNAPATPDAPADGGLLRRPPAAAAPINPGPIAVGR